MKVKCERCGRPGTADVYMECEGCGEILKELPLAKFAKTILNLKSSLAWAQALDCEVTIDGNGVNSSEASAALRPVFKAFAECFGYAEEFHQAELDGINRANDYRKEWE